MSNTISGTRQWRLTDFDIGPRLGTGKFGKVYLVREKQSHFVAALKVLSIAQLKGHKLLAQAQKELQLQRTLSSKDVGILPMFTWFMDAERIYVVIEYAIGGDLYSYMRKQPGKVLSVRDTKKVIYQLAKALDAMHSRGIAHRDIKPENILLLNEDNVNNVCLADLGWACLDKEEDAKANRRTTMCGTLDYLAPEMVRAQEYVASKVDIWAVGVLLYELLVGKPPFEAPTQSDTYRLIARCKYNLPEPLQSDKNLVLLLDMLLAPLPDQRPSAREIMSAVWLTS